MKYPRQLSTAALPSLVLVLMLGVATAAQGADRQLADMVRQGARALGVVTAAQDAEAPPKTGKVAVAKAKAASKDMVLKGDAKCTRCHDESDDYPVLAIGKTRHGVTADSRTPTCTSCHGDSETHIDKPEGVKERPKPDRTFSKNSTTTVASTWATSRRKAL